MYEFQCLMITSTIFDYCDIFKPKNSFITLKKKDIVLPTNCADMILKY